VSVTVDGIDVVATAADAEGNRLAPLIILDRVEAFLDEHGLGSGSVRAERIGIRGGSNFSFLLERGENGEGGRYVLRRPPRPPLPPSAHDMVREAYLQLALTKQGVPTPPIVAVGEDESILGVPFYVMDFVDGDIILEDLPPHLAESSERRHALGIDLIDKLAQIHGVDVHEPDLEKFIRPGSYIDRQVRRWIQLWDINKTRDLAVPEVARRMSANPPAPLPLAVVHGDYRIGNMIVAKDEPRITAVLDWEMGAIGDARADIGYVMATYTEPNGPLTALGGSRATATPGFPSKAELIARYEQETGRQLERLWWFVALAHWKSSVFCEAIYGRYIRGELGEAPQAARFEVAVPMMVDAALEALDRDEAETAR
jgi:aminoglycoside phosphotransferase (APT) family kinase protein